MALDTVKTPLKALPGLPDSLLRIFFDQGNALWNFHGQISPHGPAAQTPAHAPSSLRSPQPHEQHAANTPTKPQGVIRFSVDNAPPGTRIRASATGTAFKLDAGRDVKGDVGNALWGTSFSHEPMAPAADDGLVCRAPDIYAHAASSPLLDSTGFGGHSLDGLPKVIPSPANRGLPVHHAAQHARPDASAARAPAHGGMQKPTVSKTADDHPGFWGSLWHGTEFTAGLIVGVAEETASTVAGMARAGLDVTVGLPIAAWSDIIHEEPPSYIPNANRVLRPLGALVDKGLDYARSDHFQPFTDIKNWARRGITQRAQEIDAKWKSGDHFGAGKETGTTGADAVLTVAAVGTGGGIALRAVKGAADLEALAQISSKLRRMSGAGSRLPDVLPPTLDVPPPTAPRPTLPDAPPGPTEPSLDIKSPKAETPRPSETEPTTRETRKAEEERGKREEEERRSREEEERKRREEEERRSREEEEKRKSAEFEARRQAAIKAREAAGKKKPKRAYPKREESHRKLWPDETATLERLRKLLPDAKLKGVDHDGAEYIDKDDLSYDQMGGPNAAKPKNFGKDGEGFKHSIDRHLRKSNDFTVIDLTDFTPEQIKIIDDYIKNQLPHDPISKLPVPADSQDRIMKIGF